MALVPGCLGSGSSSPSSFDTISVWAEGIRRIEVDLLNLGIDLVTARTLRWSKSCQFELPRLNTTVLFNVGAI